MSAVLYCDGSYWPSYGNLGGWGIHGYTYENEKPKKGTGNPKAKPTPKGYGDTATVTITNYVEGIGSLKDITSSNQAELTAAIRAVDWLNDNRHPAMIRSDSKYVVEGVKHIGKWKSNGWLNSQGNPVANQPLWRELDTHLTTAQANGISVKFEWVEGHAGETGNEEADVLAKKGSVKATKGVDYSVIETVAPDGYWKRTGNPNRLLSGQNWYFISSPITDTDVPTPPYTYYIGSVPEDDMDGKRSADNSLSVIQLNQPEPVLEQLRKIAAPTTGRPKSVVIKANLTKIFGVAYDEVLKYGDDFLLRSDKRVMVSTVDKTVLLQEKSPPGIVWNTFTSLVVMENVLNQLTDNPEENQNGYQCLDITDIIYDRATNGKGIVTVSLKKSLTSKVKRLKVICPANANIGDEKKPDLIGHMTTTLVMGVDTPSRNVLSALAGDIKSVKFITWRVSNTVMEYAFYVATEHGRGLWRSPDASYSILLQGDSKTPYGIYYDELN